MDIAVHLGAHCTDADLLVLTLADNAARLGAAGVAVPPPAQARPILRRALRARADLAADAPGDVVAELLPGGGARRVVLSWEGFLATYVTALAGGAIYAEAGARTAALRDLFPGQSVSFHLALRNPATFVPALFEASTVGDFGAFLGDVDLSRLVWSAPVDAIRAACPDVPLTLWCNEDLPFLWPDVLRAVSGADGPIKGADAIVRRVLTPEGLERLGVYPGDRAASEPGLSPTVLAELLEAHAEEDEIAPDIDLPGWSEAIVAALSDAYARDVAALRARDDVTFLTG